MTSVVYLLSAFELRWPIAFKLETLTVLILHKYKKYEISAPEWIRGSGTGLACVVVFLMYTLIWYCVYVHTKNNRMGAAVLFEVYVLTGKLRHCLT
jgi:hypothetical protein